MKRIAGLVCGTIFIVSSNVFSEDYRTWRSTEIVGSVANSSFTSVRVATGSIVLKQISVTSGSVIISLFNYHTATNTAVDITRTTSVAYDCRTTGNSWNLDNEYLPGGFFFTLIGSATVRVTWDWTKTIPVGQWNRGLKIPE